jgi:hypothetical protein
VEQSFGFDKFDLSVDRIWRIISSGVNDLIGTGSSTQLVSLLLIVCSNVFILRFVKKLLRWISGKTIRNTQASSRKNRDNLTSLLPTAKSGDKFPQYSLGQLYENSYELPDSHRKANYWYQLSAEQGYALAQYKLSVNYLYGYGFPRNESNARKAVYWLNLAVKQNYVIALYELGRC